MTQSDRAKEALAAARSVVDDDALAAAVTKLKQVLGEAQNGPPQGEADGSIHQYDWECMTAFAKAAEAFVRSIRVDVPAPDSPLGGLRALGIRPSRSPEMDELARKAVEFQKTFDPSPEEIDEIAKRIAEQVSHLSD